MCPLLPCLERFENLESCLRHLLDCPCLSGASYWCSFCWDKENFAVTGPSWDDQLRSPVWRKPSRLRTFIELVKSIVKSFSPNSSGKDDVIGPSQNPLQQVEPLDKPVELSSKHLVELQDKRQSRFELSSALK